MNEELNGFVSNSVSHCMVICAKHELIVIRIRLLIGLKIIWELSGDVMKDLNTPLLDIVNRKLVEKNIDCADPFQQVDTQTASTTATAATEPSSTTTIPETTVSATESAGQTTETATTEANKATTIKASEGEVIDTASSSIVPPPDQNQALIFPERKPIKQNDKKPDRPYRPPKEELEL